MKEKITDLFDDIPVELLDEIEVQKGNGHGRKKGIYIPKWAAVLVIGLLCLFAGTAGYAAIKHPDLFKTYFGSGDGQMEKDLMQEQYHEARNKDYCLRVEDVLADGDIKYILVSVEALNADSQKALKESETFPVIRITGDSKKGTGSGGGAYEYDQYPDDGKKYFMFEWNSAGSNCTILYADGMPSMPGQDWLDEHGDEILKISFKLHMKKDKAIAVVPYKNQFPDHLGFDRVEIRRMSVRVAGESRKADDSSGSIGGWEYYYPTVTAVLEDGTSVKIMNGNMGYEEAGTDRTHPSGGASGSYSEGGDGKMKIEYMVKFRKALDIDKIDKVMINDTEYDIK